ncbi:MAG: hypothetical protein JO134_23190 [Xanthobacteraceae bacterium]|nr:hypothetical protein [Xanthobacteraceae bacterium]
MSAATSLFSPRVLVTWVAVAALLFVAMILFMMFGSPDRPTGPSAFSSSAIGYAGIADVMHRLGAPVVKSRAGSLAELDQHGVLIVAEPMRSISPQQLRSLLTGNTVLLVLPKWIGQPSEKMPGWIDDATLAPEDNPRSIARIAAPGADIVRLDATPTWTTNEIGRAPVITEKSQLVKSNRLRPVVGSPDGILIGELNNNQHRLWILADPDVLENHGLTKNATFAVALINKLRGADGNVVFDETIHGFTEQPASPFHMLFEWPFVLATVQGLVAIALLLWATMGRFGLPLTAPIALPSGKTRLIENTAKLFALARYQPVIVRRYLYAMIRDAGRALHAPPGLTDSALIAWLQRTGQARNVGVDCAAVLAAAGELDSGLRGSYTSMAALARDIFRWKQEIVDGGPRGTRPDRNHSRRSTQGPGRPG